MKIAKKQLSISVFLIVVLIALFLRFYKISTIPADLTVTEAILGYSGYSLESNGHGIDHHFLPLTYEMDRQKIFLGYSYFLIPLIRLFGLSTFIIHVPAALLGSLTILVVFLLVKEIFGSKKEKLKTIPYLVTILLIFSPWHLQFSRRALPESVFLFFFYISLYFLLKKGSSTKKINLFLSFLFLILSLLNKFWPTAILFYFFTLFILKIKINKNRLIYLFSLLVIIFSLLSLREDSQGLLYRFLSLFSSDFLFLTGDPYTGEIINTGVLLFTSLPFFILGSIELLKNIIDKKFFLVLAWLLIAFSSSLFNRANFNSQESLLGLLPLLIIVALGIFSFYHFLTHKKSFWKICLGFLLLAGFIYNLIFYFHSYYIHYLNLTQGKFIYAYKDIFDFIEKNKNNYNKIYIADKYESPGIFALYYLKYDPNKFLISEENTRHFANLYFTRFSNESLAAGEKILYIASAEQENVNGVKLKEFTINIGKIFTAWEIVNNKK